MKGKQEDIREGVVSIWMQLPLPYDNPSVEIRTNQVFSYLHSQDVVIKVERELPVPVYSGCCKITQQEMLKAGYVAVESIIK